MKIKLHCRLLVGLLAWMIPALLSHAELTHRYSFNTDASDSVGNANGTANGGVSINGGIATFDGNAGSFIDLPSGMISNYNSVTFEFWIDVGGNGNWPELYAFGDRNSGGAGRHMLMFTPHSGSTDFRMSFADGDPGYTHEFVVTQPGVLDNLGPIHIAAVYDPANHAMVLYTNGIVAASRTDLGDFYNLTNVWNVHSWLGQSLYAPDAPYAGSINEFRIYNTALDATQVAGSFSSGPETPSTDPGAIAALNVSVKTPLVKGGVATATATVDYATIKGVPLANISGVLFSSSNTNILSVTTNGAVKALGVGNAAVVVTFQGKTGSSTVNVTSDVATTLTHRYTFETDVSDVVGGANGTLESGATVSNGAVVLDGGAYVELPPDLFTNYDSVTFEAWVTDDGSANWARIWDFGNSVNGPGQQGGGTRYMFLSLPAGGGNLLGGYRIAPGAATDQVLEWPGGRPPAGKPSHIVWTTDAAYQLGKLYFNGALVGINTNFTLTPRDVGPTSNDWLGRSQYNDPAFKGSIDEFRIYNGALTPLQVALNSASGPTKAVSEPGTLQSVQMSIGTNQVYYGGLPVLASLLANYQNQSNVNVTTLEGAVLKSSDPSVLTIATNGVVNAVKMGTATLTGVYAGQTGTLSVTVGQLPGYTKPTLVHRYTFSDSPGSKVVKDSVGTADGAILGVGATFDGKQLQLPGGNSSGTAADTIAGYVDLPNNIISPLTDISIETWVTWQGTGSWQRILDFGTSVGGEDISNGQGNYIFLTPQADGPAVLKFSIRDPITGAEPAQLNAPAPLAANQEIYIAVSYDYTANVSKLYSNAVLVAATTAPIAITSLDDVNNWLGRSQWNDAMFRGKYNEFRIWNGVLLPDQIASDYSAGPDSLEPRPTLTATVSGKNLTISWSSSAATGLVLQSSATVGTGAKWTTVTTPPTTANGVSSVVIPIGNGTEFFRLGPSQ